VFGIFFNQNENEILAHKEVRKALEKSINKDDIIENVLSGFGTVINDPLPPSKTGQFVISPKATTSGNMSEAIALLAAAKWKKNPDTGIFELKGKNSSSTLSLSLSTANIPELVESARRIEANWNELGAEVDIRVFEPTDLNPGVIRPRKYDALLFGIVTGKSSDLYPFWHSSQRNDPGLNISLYTNAKADKILEKMRISTSTKIIAEQYALLKAEIEADTPAIFLWSPDYIYAVPDKLHGVMLGEITTPSDRFSGVEKWYVETDSVWKIFVNDQNKIINN
jgi:peptide/nickel transport system substrate-binding protein